MTKEERGALVLFATRLFVYFCVFSLPAIHPAVSVAYDRGGIALWFFVIPCEAAAAFFLGPPRFGVRSWLAFAAGVLVFGAAAGPGFTAEALPLAAGGGVSFVLTALLFRFPRWGKIAVLEQIFFALTAFRMLGFSRSSEETAARSAGLTQGIMIFLVAAFLLHGAVIYLSLFRSPSSPREDASGRGKKRRRELAVFGISAAAAVVLFLIVLPPDFVKNSIVANLLQDEVESQPVPLDEEGQGRPDRGGLRSDRGENGQNRRRGPRGMGGGEDGPRLEGIPESQWPNMGEGLSRNRGEGDRGGGGRGRGEGGEGGRGRSDGGEGDEGGRGRRRGEDGEGAGGGEEKQYAVMVVASRRAHIYAASLYKGELHPLRGFLPIENEVLNTLPTLRLLETWRGSEYSQESMRSREEIFSLSMLPEKYIPYRPLAVEPTVLQQGYGPFRYSHRVWSSMSSAGMEDMASTRGLTESEKEEFAVYLEAPLAKNSDLPVFEAHLRGALEAAEKAFEAQKKEAAKSGGAEIPPGAADSEADSADAEGEDADTGEIFPAAANPDDPETYLGKIAAILKSFSAFQYNAGFEDNSSIPALVDFLTYTREGDCVEFSNSAAVLGRLAGIPSRVVTGFLASEKLQTPAHQRGLALLREKIKPLQDFPLDELILVTTAHRHSWVQFYLPEYGWIDFEATSFALPPMGFGDANNRDVVIPIFEKEEELRPLRVFPWKLLFQGLGIFAAGGLFAVYAFRYGRECFLHYKAEKGGREGARALYRLLAMRLAVEGKPLRQPSQTSREYAAFFPDEPAFAPFAALYTELLYRETG
ncbi:MAG: DUF3488 and transglutaminase-like domain-containing protein, partial [Spirochaetales bacterium]|nr:DUF3488 and transglutaminase-like domain-containing protein [Spirochaetales bacterium]